MANLSTERVSFEQALLNLLDFYGIEGGTGGTGTILPTRLDLITVTKAKLDELIPEGEGVVYDVEDAPNVSDPYDLLINTILDEAAKRVLMNAPRHYLDPVKGTMTATPDTNDNKIGYIVLPDNFLRFVSLKMQDWHRPVIDLVPYGSDEHLMQGNRHVRGGVAKPKAVMTHRAISTTAGDPPVTTVSQKKVIEYYSIAYTHSIDWLYYIQETTAEDVQINLWDALTWMCAGMVLQIIEKQELAALAFQQEQACYKNL